MRNRKRDVTNGHSWGYTSVEGTCRNAQAAQTLDRTHLEVGVGNMRKKLIGLFILGCVSALLLIPSLGVGQQRDTQKGKKGGKGGGDWTDMQAAFQGFQAQGGLQGFQQGGKGGKGGKGDKGGKGGMGGMFGGAFGGLNIDANKIFDSLSKGSDVIQISQTGPLSVQLQQMALQQGNGSGVVTRQQFSGYMQSILGGMQSQAKGGAKGGKGKGNPDEEAARRFKGGDKNGDNYLNPDEMTSQLKAVWKKYDRDGNNLLDVEEYKGYWREVSSTASIGGGKGNNPMANMSMFMIEENWDARPTVFRIGKMPPGMPDWFGEYDIDRDGQIGLYEWRPSGKPFVEFQIMDRNGDGLVTAEELIWYRKSITSLGNSTLDAMAYSQMQNSKKGKGANGKKGGNNNDPFGLLSGFGGFGGGGKGGNKGFDKGNNGGGGKGGGGKGGGGKGGGKGGGGKGGNNGDMIFNFGRGGGDW